MNNLQKTDMGDMFKIGFKIEDSALGSTVANLETLWAKKISDDEYEINSIPFDAYGVSWGDVISAKPTPDGLLMYDKTVKHGGHSTFRLKVFHDETSEYTDSLVRRINILGCGTEGSRILKNFVAIDVPPNISPDTIGNLLAEEAKGGILDFEESSVPDSYISKKKISRQ